MNFSLIESYILSYSYNIHRIIDFASSIIYNTKNLYPSSGSETGRMSNNHNKMLNCVNMCVKGFRTE